MHSSFKQTHAVLIGRRLCASTPAAPRAAVAISLALLAFCMLVGPSRAVAQEPAAPYIVTFAPGVSDATARSILADAGATVDSHVGVLRMYSVAMPAGGSDALAARTGVARVEADLPRDTAAIPDDPDFGTQWALSRIGWDSVYGSVTPAGSATVAVLDTGVDATQPELSRNLVAGTSIIDGSAGTTDPNGHGTSMAGIVAAATNDGQGIAGVGYAGVNVMPVTVLGADGTGRDSDVIEGVVYAADHGADVVLMSFSNPGFSASLQAALDYAWGRGVVLVAATGNDASATPSFPAGDRGVVGVASTGMTDALSLTSNFGSDTFLAAPGEGIASVNGMVTGTSAAAAIVAGSAALIRATSVGASNGVVVSRLARTADPTATPAQTGNGRVNLARAMDDASTDFVQPAGAAPVGTGGPLVGPYVAAAAVKGDLQTQNKVPCVSPSPCPWQTANASGWAELDTAPVRLFLGAGQSAADPASFTISIDHSTGGTAGLESLDFVSKSTNVTLSPIAFSKATNGAGAETWSYTFTVDMTNNLEGEVVFKTRLLAGSHAFSGASLQIKGAGVISFVKPAAAPGAPDLKLTKTGLTSVAPGQTMTYTLAYQNLASGAANGATGVQLTDVLPPEVTYVPGSCTGCTFNATSNSLSWLLGSIAAGSASATKTYQVTVASNLANGASFSNDAKILSAENDANTADNASKVTTSVVVTAISGTVLDDQNGNGLDDSDPPLAGAAVKLFLDSTSAGTGGVLDAADTQVGTTVTTSGTGDWSFGSLPAVQNRTYFVSKTNPTGYTSTGALPGSGLNSTTTKVTNDVFKVAFGTGATGRSTNNKFLAQAPQNAAPVAGTVAIAPTSPTTNQTLTATPSGFTDANGDTLTYHYVWKNGTTTVGTDSSTLSLATAGNGDKGDVITVSVTASDGTASSAAATDHVTVVNTPPVAGTVSLSPASPNTNDTLVATASATGWTDADSDLLTFTYQWKKNGVVIVGQTGSTLDLSQSGNGAKGDTISVTVTATDTSGASDSASASKTIVNSAPVAGSVSISPVSPTTGQTVTATPSGFSDADGDTLTYHYVWKNGTTTVGSDSSTLDLGLAGNGNKGDVITVSVTASDGTASSAAVTDQVTVANSAPVVGTVAIAPTSPTTNQTLTAAPSGFSDPDGDTLTYHYVWKKGTATVGSDSSTLNLATAGNGDKGDVITVSVTATDGTASSSAATDHVTVANSAPVAGTVTLSPASPTTNQTLTATKSAAGWTDADGDTLSYSYVWRKNGVVIAGETGSTLNLAASGNGDKGDSISVTVTVSDGTASDSASDSTTVANSAPVAGTVTLSPASPTTNQTLTATKSATGWTDADGDTLTYSYVWKKNDVVIAGATGSTLNLATSGNGDKGDVISVILTATDTSASSDSASDATTVVNSAPVAGTVTLSPASPTTNQTLTATRSAAGWTDADNDTLSYSYVWRKNGIVIAGATTSSLDLSQPGNGAKGDTISVTVTATDTSNASDSASASETVANSAPVVGTVTISPASPTTNQTVTATPAGFSDADTDGLTYHYVWKNGTTTVGSDSSTLNLATTGNGDKGDVITVSVTATDGTASSSAATDHVTVANSAPVAGTVTLSPASPTTNQTLTATKSTTGWTDADGDTLTYSYVWKKNNVVIAGATTSSLDLSQSGNGARGDTITVTLTATDTSNASDSASASETVANSAPVAGTVTISPASPTTNQTLTATPAGFSDADTDGLTYHYVWKKGTTTVGTDSSTLNLATAGNGDKGDVITVSVTASDGTASSSAATDHVTVANSAPVAGTVTLSPSPPKTDDTLTATRSAAGWTDADGDTLSYSYVWKKNGVVIAGETGSTLNLAASGNGAKGDTISVTVTVTDTSNESDSASTSTTVADSAPTIALSRGASNAQYSDPIQSITATANDADGDPITLTATSVPLGLTFTDNGGGSGTLAGNVQAAPGSYSPTITATSAGRTATATPTITVTQEDARTTYTGLTFVPTGSATATTATVPLSATIQDITAVTGDTAYDADAGDIRKAKVTFVNRDAGNAPICIADLVPSLVTAGDTKTGTVTCNWTATIPTNSDSAQFAIGIKVGGHYLRDDSGEDTIVTVSKQIGTGFITGGGYLVNSASAGQFAGENGRKTNFGFNVKYNKAGTNLQGNINSIIRNAGRVYQIKGNAMTSLVTQIGANSTSPSTATFTGKANIQDITNPALPVSMGGGATLQVTMTDWGEPGSKDTIGITVWSGTGGLWFSSNWSGTKTVEQLLGGADKPGGGNLVVH